MLLWCYLYLRCGACGAALLCACVSVCVCARARVGVCVGVCVWRGVGACVWVRVCGCVCGCVLVRVGGPASVFIEIFLCEKLSVCMFAIDFTDRKTQKKISLN